MPRRIALTALIRNLLRACISPRRSLVQREHFVTLQLLPPPFSPSIGLVIPNGHKIQEIVPFIRRFPVQKLREQKSRNQGHLDNSTQPVKFIICVLSYLRMDYGIWLLRSHIYFKPMVASFIGMRTLYYNASLKDTEYIDSPKIQVFHTLYAIWQHLLITTLNPFEGVIPPKGMFYPTILQVLLRYSYVLTPYRPGKQKLSILDIENKMLFFQLPLNYKRLFRSLTSSCLSPDTGCTRIHSSLFRDSLIKDR